MIPDRARVVIIGSGIAGSSIAYHLTELGWNDVIVLDQGELISGTTSHPPGLVGQMRTSPALIKLLMYSVSLYKDLPEYGEPGFSQVGSLRLASSKRRWQESKELARLAKSAGLEAELISAAQAQKLFPLMSVKGVEGALFFPTDGSARAPLLAKALADGARGRGARFYPQTPVTDFEIKRGQITAIKTAQGRIETEVAVVAAGIWSPRVGRLAGVSIPLVPMQHQWAKTEPLAQLHRSMPNLRDPDNRVYFRVDQQTLSMGGYEATPKTFRVESIPANDNPTVRPFDSPRFKSLLRGGIRRVPQLRAVKWIQQTNGLESFTPDGNFILGEAPEVRGLWVACGFCAHGVSGAGGVGKTMAEWIVSGQSSFDMRQMDIRRFGPEASSRRYVAERAVKVYQKYYSIGALRRIRRAR